MERNRFRENNKKELIKKYAIALVITMALIIVFILMYNSNKKSQDLGITETANTDYKVYLNDNEFYEEDHMESDKQYVSSLIKSITAKYNYNLNSKNADDFNYTYTVNATLDICDTGTKKSLYTYTENLLPEKNLTSDNGQISIEEEVNIDYQHFNDIASKFINVYALSVANTSTLKVNLLVKTEHTEESSVTLSVPLNKHTFDIGTSNQLASGQLSNIPVVKKNKTVEKISVLGFVSALSVFVLSARKLIKIVLDSRTDEEKYKSNLKKILLNYGEYINKTNDFQFKLDEYEIIRVNTFLDLLKIKEDLSRPILMIENKEKTNVVFAITDNSNFIYMYALNMHQKKLAEKNEKTNIENWS